MSEKNYKIEGLTCASCASSIEDKARDIEDLENVSIDLMNNSVKLKVKDESKRSEVLEKLNKLADKIEPGSKIKNKNEEIEEAENNNLFRIIFSAILLALGLIISNSTISFALLFLAYIIVGYDVIILAIKNILRLQALDEHFLMSIATIGALIIGENFEAVLVMLLYQIGEYLQDAAVSKSKKSISDLMDIKAEYAIKVENGKEIKVKPEDVKVDDFIIIRPGEKIPLDGIVIEGSSSVDAKALTGESLYKVKEKGSEVLSGSINVDGLLKIKVTKPYGESTVSQILDLVENASSKKAKSENYIARFAKYYTPIVVFIALMLAFVFPLIAFGRLIDYDYIYRALTFLVISCPCALVISVPLSFFGGIGGASRKGILFKGSNYIEALAKADHVLFDKTGTLTKGNFVVEKIDSEYKDDYVIELAAMAEYFSNHPIALSIVEAYGKDIDQTKIKDVEEIAHHGVKVNYKDEEILVGNYKLMQLYNINVEKVYSEKSIVYVAKDGEFIGSITLADEIKAESKEAVLALKSMNVKKVEMLTGDNDSIAQEVAKELKLDNVYSQLYPKDKVEVVENYLKEDKSVVFVGDGINDAPVITLASVGVAMGALGSDAAIEAADVVIMDDNPSKLAVAKKQAQKTMRIVKQNIFFAIGVKMLFLVLGGLGISSMAMAVFADVGVSLIAILNAIRLLRI